MNPSDRLERGVIESAVESFRANKELAERAVAQLDDRRLHESVAPHTNSVAVIMKHVAGNLISRWTDFLTSDGEKPWRDRDREFIDTFSDRAELLAYWERGWTCLFTTLGELTPKDAHKTVEIRGEPHSVPGAIHRALAHCGYHVGQIVMTARALAGEEWRTLSIPPGGSAQYDRRAWKR